MQSPQALTLSELQQFIEHPEQLANQPVEYQLAVANYSEAPRQLLEVLAKSTNFQVAEAASMHVNLAGEAGEDWQDIAEAAMKTAPLGQNDRLVAELLKFAPVPEVLVSEWMPGHRLIEGIENLYMAPRHRVKLLQRLALSPIIEERLKAAAHQDTPYTTLEQLAGDLELPIRIAVKYHHNSPTKIIELLVAQHEIAQNWETNPEELALLANSPWSWIRLAVARNPYTPHETLAKLAQDSEEKIQLAVARNLFTPAEVLDLLVNHYYQAVTEAVAKHPNASEETLNKLLPKHKLYISDRYNFNSGKLTKYIQFIKDSSTSSSVLAQIDIESCPWQWRVQLAQHPNVSVNILKKLSHDSCPLVRLSVFQNTNISESLINNLLAFFQKFIDNKLIFEDRSTVITAKDIRLGLATSQNTPVAILEEIGKNLSCFGTLAVALIANPNTPVNLRNKLTQKLISLSKLDRVFSDWEIYYVLSFNLEISEDQRNEYFKLFQQNIINDTNGCRTLSKSLKTPPYVLELLATTDAVDGVAQNPNTPPHVLNQLAKHISPYVRECVVKNPSTPLETLSELLSQPNLEIGNFKFNTYNDYVRFAYEYPNVPKLELYSILLVKEAEEEAQNINSFIRFNKENYISAKAHFDAIQDDIENRCRFARMCNTPITILEELAKDGHAEVRAEVSKNPNLPQHCLIELAKDPLVYIRRNLASYDAYNDKNKIIPIEVFEILAADEAQEVRKEIASNPRTPVNILTKLAKDSSLEVKKRIAKNPNTPIDALEYLWQEDKLFEPKNHNTPGYIISEVIAKTSDSEKLTKILENYGGQLPVSCLKKLAMHGSNIVRGYVARRSNTPLSVLERLTYDDYWFTQCSLASNPNTPPYLLEELLIKWRDADAKNHYQLCWQLAQRRDLPPNLFDYLVSIDNYRIRQAVAENTSTPEYILEKLTNRNFLKHFLNRDDIQDNYSNCYSSDDYLLRCLAYNKSLTHKLLDILSQDPSPDVRICLISHPNLTPELWIKLANDQSFEVRKAIAYHRKSPVDILELLVSDEVQEVRQNLASNPNTPLSILEKLVLDISPSVRQAVAANSSTPVNLLEKLEQDENKEVSQALIENPNTPPKLRQVLQYKLRLSISPTLRGLNRLYNPEKDDLITILSEYAQSPVLFIRFIALMHSKTPIAFFEKASQSFFWLERYAIAVNPVAPGELREKLVEDANRIVKAAARANL